MEKNDQIDIRILREVTARIFDFVEKDLKLSSVDLASNFYWSIDDESLFNTDETPKELDVGSLLDDWEFVLSAWKHPDRALPANLAHVAALLRAIAIAVPSYVKPEDEQA